MAAILYDLTEVTGQAAQQRRTEVILGRDVDRHLALSAVAGLLIGLLAAGITAPLLRVWSIAVLMAVAGTATVIIHGRSTKGLKIRLWRAMWNKARAANGIPFQCNAPLSPDRWGPRFVMSSIAWPDDE